MPKMTKIICTLGPASDTLEKMEQLVKEGANVFRLNFSHGTHEEHAERIQKIRQLREKLHCPIGILLDTGGPEIRLKTFASGCIDLQEGMPFCLTTQDVIGDQTRVAVTYERLPQDVRPGDKILIDDGLVELVVESINDTEVFTRCTVGGRVYDRKGVNIPGVEVHLPALTPKDERDLLFGISQKINFVAASFVRTGEDAQAVRNFLDANGGKDIMLISKIENQQGVDHMEEILKISDGIMVARGDLGVEVPVATVPLLQKEMIYTAREHGKIVITATQMLDSMIRNPRPTRAEVNDVATAVYDGSDAVMLSGETAAGRYPVLAVRTMSAVCRNTEAHSWRAMPRALIKMQTPMTVTRAVAQASCTAANELNAKAIITATSSGHTAKVVARERPTCPIIATTDNLRVYHGLSLVWGVQPALCAQYGNTDEMMDHSIAAALKAKLIRKGDTVVLTAGIPTGFPGTTNMMKVHTVQ